jgi:hypothetical protein
MFQLKIKIKRTIGWTLECDWMWELGQGRRKVEDK